jgi:hypothetical protein
MDMVPSGWARLVLGIREAARLKVRKALAKTTLPGENFGWDMRRKLGVGVKIQTGR